MQSSSRQDYRLDIQGIRAICMIQVLLFHAWNVGSPIGVDSFIMISAFLMAGGFLRAVERGQRPRFYTRWVHTFKRLLPPLVVTVLGTALASVWILPPSRQSENLIQAVASLTYWENWRLMEVATDYYAGDHSLASPFQHLWSMSMQGQIFLLWPVIMAFCAWLGDRLGASVRVVTAIAFAVLTVIPLGWLLLSTHDGGVYFDTRARIWEFAFGSTIAIIVPFIHFDPWLQRLLSWLGLGALVTFCLVSIGTYPGPMAFVPMSAVTAMLIAGNPGDRWNATCWLAVKPLVTLGNISYSVYLVHWPIFVLYLTAMGQERVSVTQGIAIIVVSLAAALVLHFGVDRPFMRLRWARTPMRQLLVVFLSLYVGLTPFLVVLSVQQGLREADAKKVTAFGLTDPQHPGGWVLLSGTPFGADKSLTAIQRQTLWTDIRQAVPETAKDEVFSGQLFTEPPMPSAVLLNSQWAGLTHECSSGESAIFDHDNSTCRTNGVEKPGAVRAFIVGDSHAEQLILPMLEPYAAAHG